MQYMTDILTVTVPTTGTFAAYDLVSVAGAKIAADDAVVLGVAKHPNTVIGDLAGIMVIGTARLRASGSITAGAKVISAAAGGVKTGGASPDNPIGIALQSAADGEFVDILIR